MSQSSMPFLIPARFFVARTSSSELQLGLGHRMIRRATLGPRVSPHVRTRPKTPYSRRCNCVEVRHLDQFAVVIFGSESNSYHVHG